MTPIENKPVKITLSSTQKEVIRLMRKKEGTLLRAATTMEWFFDKLDIKNQTAQGLLDKKLVEAYGFLARDLMEYSLTEFGKTIKL